MPITRMISRERFEQNVGKPGFFIVHDYEGAEAGLIRHSPACARFHTSAHRGIKGQEIGPGFSDCIGYEDPRRHSITSVNTGVYGTNANGESGYLAGTCSGPFEPLYMETSHIGLVLDEGERNGYDDSDFYAIVWNPTTNATDEITYASTRGWTYPNSATVDATPEVRAAYQAHLEAKRDAWHKAQAAKEALTVGKGKTVEVFKGRKVPVGVKGVIFWVGVGQYGERVGIKDAKGAVHWTASANVRVIPT